eukprot:2076100-Prymnesium_polylepis.1
MRGAADSMSNVVRPGGGGLLAVMTVHACGVGWVLVVAGPLCGRHHPLRAVLRPEMRPVLAAE